MHKHNLKCAWKRPNSVNGNIIIIIIIIIFIVIYVRTSVLILSKEEMDSDMKIICHFGERNNIRKIVGIRKSQQSKNQLIFVMLSLP